MPARETGLPTGPDRALSQVGVTGRSSQVERRRWLMPCPPLQKGTVLHVQSSTSHGMWTARPGEGRKPNRGAVPAPTYPVYGRETARPGAGAYFGSDVPVPYEHRVTPSGVAWAFTLFALQCAALRLVLGFPGLGAGAAANDRMIADWLPLFLLACASAPLVAIALAADRPRSALYTDYPDIGHPVRMPLLCGLAIALSGVAAVALVATQGPHTVAAVLVGAAVAAATACGTAAGLLTVFRPMLRTPACWAVLAVWVGLLLRRAFTWAVVASDVDMHMHLPADLNGEVPYASLLLAAGVAGTMLIGGISGFVGSRGQAPLLAAIAGLWLCATALGALGPGLSALALAPWRVIAGCLAGAIAGVLLLAARSWWREYR